MKKLLITLALAAAAGSALAQDLSKYTAHTIRRD